MRDPLITVITAVRNAERHLGETIASIQSQDVTDWEYIIVDDLSTDGTIDIVRRAMEQDRRVRLVIRTETGGPYTAANDALRTARGRYIVRTDGDDLQPPDRFSKQIRFLAEQPQFKACVTYWRPFHESTGVLGSIETVPSPGAFKWYLLLRSASIHSSLCIEREAMLAIGGYRELPLSQDYRLWCELTLRGWLGVVPEALSYVRFHVARSTNRRGPLQRDLAKDVLRDHWLALTGTECSAEQIETLWALGYSLPYDLAKALAMLDRWDALWKRDQSLTDRDRVELASLSALRRRKLLRSNLRLRPVKTLFAALKLRTLETAKS